MKRLHILRHKQILSMELAGLAIKMQARLTLNHDFARGSNLTGCLVLSPAAVTRCQPKSSVFSLGNSGRCLNGSTTRYDGDSDNTHLRVGLATKQVIHRAHGIVLSIL